MQSFHPSEISESISTVEFEDSGIHRTLGVAWDVKEDNFVMKVNLPQRPFTKRGILSVINSIYDPVGFVSPVVLGGRLVQRMILPRNTDHQRDLSNYGWDDPLPPEMSALWEQWRTSIDGLSTLKIPRCLKPKRFGNVSRRTLHIFCDASQDSIGHVVYIRSTNDAAGVHVSFLYGESKVSPKSATSIPRLELCAAVDAAFTIHRIKKELVNKPDEVYFFTDSRVVLGYINNCHKRFSQYVSRRVEMVLSLSSSKQWNYISSPNNPADVATRPITSEQLTSSVWFQGPKYLQQYEHVGHSTDSIEANSLPEEVPEMKRVLVSVKTTENTISSLILRHSNWNKLIRITKRMLEMSWSHIHRHIQIKGASDYDPIKGGSRLCIRKRF